MEPIVSGSQGDVPTVSFQANQDLLEEIFHQFIRFNTISWFKGQLGFRYISIFCSLNHSVEWTPWDESSALAVA